jgi:hypothetical protein
MKEELTRKNPAGWLVSVVYHFCNIDINIIQKTASENKSVITFEQPPMD